MPMSDDKAAGPTRNPRPIGWMNARCVDCGITATMARRNVFARRRSSYKAKEDGSTGAGAEIGLTVRLEKWQFAID